MTSSRAKALLPVIQAHAEGKPIEVQTQREWVETSDPSFHNDSNYRVAPPKPRVVYITEDRHVISGFGRVHSEPGFGRIKFIEVLE